MEGTTIFIVEDEESIRELLKCTLEPFSYDVAAFENGEDLLTALKDQIPSLILLDIMLPGISGMQVLGRLKQTPAYQKIPVLLVTAKSTEIDKVKGLDIGADDYITKPFSTLELAARVRSALRRNQPEKSQAPLCLQVQDLSLNPAKREVTCDERILCLSRKEFELLQILMKNPDRVVTRDELLNQVWGYDFAGETRTVDMHVKTLRGKLGDDADHPRYIRTVRGIGYLLQS